MDTKLTLKLDKDVIAALKDYAKKQGTSVSRLVESYARKVVHNNTQENNILNEPLAPWLQDIKDITSKYPPVLETDKALHNDYRDYLDKKYS